MVIVSCPGILESSYALLWEARRCKPRIYITYVRKVVERENPGLEPLEQAEPPNTFLLQTFRGYLKGHALQLFEEERLGDKTLKDIIPLFEEKFSKPNTAEDGAPLAEAHPLARNKYESLQTFIDCTGKPTTEYRQSYDKLCRRVSLST
ncbi:Uncharacterized protein HZ326_21532 [Fusarium oxysporum f. sp. albedinis]|nr:Uncharacterized protein HZ326_21532 [Fusarium oxysporum f. sp. albedinis]